MAPIWNRLVGKSKTARRKSRRRHSRNRRLRSETLETRQLLAANLFHNEAMAEDVNEDGLVSALDALTIINEIRRIEADGNGRNDRPEGGRGRMTDVNNDGRDSAADALMVINRLNRGRDNFDSPRDDRSPTDPDGGGVDPVDPDDDSSTSDPDVRSIDGTGNNIENPELGSTDTALLRVAENDYADGISEPSGEDRPSAREISNTLSAANPEGTTSERNLTSFVSAWGQFLDHDIDLSEHPADEADQVAFNVEVPTGDPLFDPFATGEATISLTRSEIAEGTGTSTDNPAEQVNSITTWIDGSQVYGSDQATSDALREFVGGRMLITDDGLLPSDENGGLLAGDIRAAENVVLTSMHAVFLREHNRLADNIAAENPGLTDEEIFQAAREIVIAEMQSITVNEYLPALLGQDALSDYEGYDSSVDPSIANEFSTAAFRFGHSTLNDEFRLVGNDGEDVDDPVTLAGAFFQPEMLEATGIDSFLKYASSTLSQEIDLEVVDGLRNFLFGAPGSGGLDLVSLNIQRGRDHGLADYNSTRVAYGLETVESFDQITSDADVQAKLESLYGDVNNIDLWVGLLAEDHTESGSLGETATTIIADQFERLRDGDRFWYENVMSNREIRQIENTTLADIIERNTEIDSLQDNVFVFAPEVSGRVMTQTNPESPVAPESIALEELTNARTGMNETDLDLLAQDQVREASRRGNDRGTQTRSPQDPRGGQENPPVLPPVLQPMAGMTVELLDSEGVLVDSTLTDEAGYYHFVDFEESGNYTIRLADDVNLGNSDSIDVNIASGDEHIEGMDFRVLV